MSDSKITKYSSPIERFVMGFLFGGLSGFFGVFLYDQQLVPALIAGISFAVLIGGACALLGKRISDFIIELITRFF